MYHTSLLNGGLTTIRQAELKSIGDIREEWLMMQDLPMREYMQERMGVQRTQNWVTMVSQAVTQYAGLVDQGVDPEEAIAATADTMARQAQPGGENAVQDQMAQLEQGNSMLPMM